MAGAGAKRGARGVAKSIAGLLIELWGRLSSHRRMRSTTHLHYDPEVRYEEPPVAAMVGEQRPEDPVLSVVIPAYNAEGTLPRALDALMAQGYPESNIEVVVIDDGSSDGTWGIIERYAAAYPGSMRGIRFASPSGTPSIPRNKGLSEARGEYVFFHDADDWVGPQAIRKMIGHARKWDSDVLYLKVVGEGGRSVPRAVYAADQPRVDIWRSRVFTAFWPHKVFRRSLIAGFRFPLDLPEDVEFVLRAVMEANTVSVAADCDYYHITLGESEGNASDGIWDHSAEALRSLRRILALTAERAPAGKRDRVLVRRLMRVDVCRTLLGIANEAGDDAAGHFAEIVSIARPFCGAAVRLSLPRPHRALLKAAFGRGGSLAKLRMFVSSPGFNRTDYYD